MNPKVIKLLWLELLFPRISASILYTPSPFCISACPFVLEAHSTEELRCLFFGSVVVHDVADNGAAAMVGGTTAAVGLKLRLILLLLAFCNVHIVSGIL